MSRFEIGVPRKKFGGTRISNATWSKQSFNLFQQQQQEQEDENANPMNKVAQTQDDSAAIIKPAARAAPGGSSSAENPLAAAPAAPAYSSQTLPLRRVSVQSSNIFSDAPADFQVRPSSRVLAAPGGRSSVKDLFSGVPQVPESQPAPVRSSSNNIFATDAPIKSSTRIHAAPGGGSVLGAILNHETPEVIEAKKKLNPQMVSSVFSDEAVAFKPSTKRLAPVGGQSQANIFASDAPADKPQSFHTAKANESHNVFCLSPEQQRRPSITAAKKNQSNNVINLTPAKSDFAGQRTYKANEESQQEEEETEQEKMTKHSTHNKMMQSNVFAPSASDREQQVRKSSTRVLSAPGGKSANIFSS